MVSSRSLFAVTISPAGLVMGLALLFLGWFGAFALTGSGLLKSVFYGYGAALASIVALHGVALLVAVFSDRVAELSSTDDAIAAPAVRSAGLEDQWHRDQLRDALGYPGMSATSAKVETRIAMDLDAVLEGDGEGSPGPAQAGRLAG